MKTLEELTIKIDHEKIATFFRERGIQKMSLFGYVVRDDFDQERNDVDVIVPVKVYQYHLKPDRGPAVPTTSR